MNGWIELQNNLPPVVTLIGGGGKTGLMNYLVALLVSSGAQAVATTTTKLSTLNKENRFAEIHNVAQGYQLLKNSANGQGVLTLVRGQDTNNNDKMVGIPKKWVDQFAAQFPNIYFVVEGDGSAGRSLKGHLPHEPVIPASSRLLIPVIGIDVIGAPLNSSHVHRPERVAQMIGAQVEATVTSEMVLKLLFHPEGYLKNLPSHCSVLPFINKVERQKDFRQAQRLAQGILSHGSIEQVIIGSLIRQEFTTLYREGEENH